MTEENASKETSNKCGGKKKRCSLMASSKSPPPSFPPSPWRIAFGLCAVKQESKAFNGCVQEVIAEGKTNAAAVRFCNGGN